MLVRYIVVQISLTTQLSHDVPRSLLLASNDNGGGDGFFTVLTIDRICITYVHSAFCIPSSSS